MGMTLAAIMQMRPTLLHEFVIPDGMNQETLARTIMMRAQPFYLLYEDPDYMGWHIRAWAERHKYKWDGLWASMHFDYELLVNIDLEERTIEKITETGEREEKVTEDGTASTVSAGNVSETESGKIDKTAREDTTGKESENSENSESVDKDGTVSGTVNESGTKRTDIEELQSSESFEDVEEHTHTDGENRTDNLYQGFNSSTHRPASRADVDGTTDGQRTAATGKDGASTLENETRETDSRDTITETDSGEHSETAGTASTERTSESAKDGTENTVTASGRDSETRGIEDVTTGTVRDSGEKRADNKFRELVHTTRGDSSLRSTPSVIQEERELRLFDMYAIIAADFVGEFCIMVY